MIKPYYRTKGKYTDGRQRIVIEWGKIGSKKCKTLPKPEVLLDTLKSLEKTKENKEDIRH